MEEFDAKKSYYDILGVAPSATAEEMKSAFVKLALTHHPDVSTGSKDSKSFALINEAWGVLSKPDVRERYDAARNYPRIGLVSDLNNYDAKANASIDLSNHKASFVVAQKNATSNWRDLQDKYKTEKWQSMPLSDRKAFRRRPVVSLGGGIAQVALPLILVAGAGVLFVSLQ